MGLGSDLDSAALTQLQKHLTRLVCMSEYLTIHRIDRCHQ